MAFDYHTPVEALRDAIATAVSATVIPEAGAGTDLANAGAEFYAYRVGSVEVTEGEPASYDTTVVIPVEVFYCRRKTAGDEGLAEVRSVLDTIADTVQDFASWTVSSAINMAVVTGQGTGDADTYGSVFVDAGHLWDAGHVECELTVIC